MRLVDLGSLGMCVLLFATATPARAQTQEEKRRQLQERLGIQRPPTPAPSGQGSADAGSPESPGAPTAPTGATTPPVATPSAPRPGAAARPRGPTFADDARPILAARCGSCHRPEGMAGKTRWVLRGDGSDLESTLRFVKVDAAAQSPLLKKGTGATLHGGKKSLAAESPEYATLVKWIDAGAPAGRAVAVAVEAPPPPAPSASARPSTVATSSEPSAPARVAEASPPPPTPVAQAVDAPAAPVAQAVDAPAAPAVSDDTLRFAPRIHEQLLAGCAGCHAADGFAGSTRYVAGSEPEPHLRTVLALVTPGSVATSLLYQRARGDAHQGGAVWEQGSAELALLARWIDGGAHGAAKPAVATAPSPAPAVAVAAPPPAERPAASSGGPPPGVQLGTFPVLGSLTLNGRFDLNYERLGYNDQPFQGGASNALRSYHHFLFLTRQSTSDPVTLTLEMLSLQFWEVGYRVSGEDWPVKVSAKAGKVLVPFGAEPLFHHSYGGLAGFDQKVLPPVFAREGVTANVQRREGPFLLSADVYVIAGYQLRRADSVLNLQSDFAPLEQTRLGLGTRLGGSWGPLSLWYSAYYNSLGFGRRLFLQSLDVASWRPRGLPVLERFSLAAGFLRADVSGGEAEGYGGPGADYYHFASYFQLRFHPTDWLYLQYRQGLRTFGNQRGQILDSTALTREDASAHNVGAVARWKGLSVGLFQFWNLEKVDEVADDFTRLVVAYEF
ncbi:hypothetical protein LZ198_03610 [Myxococcus sp. K15C18031901]|uniref:hypothetical protein n=1 Tax=Myxococcus dinghuensis TaxID=2906761 RepID=UPI0020A7A336|nr:hypothetical protein [Myxococcus dinghuensis]MCP3097959.1 hypothetical protein [Myxococcus dinghuensis]